MQRPSRKERKAGRRLLQENLFKLIDSYEAENIDLALAIMYSNRGLRDAAKRRYYPIMRLIDPDLGGSWQILHEVKGAFQGYYTEFLEEFYKIYVENGGLENVRELLQTQYERAFMSVNSGEDLVAAQRFGQLEPAPIELLSLYGPVPQEFKMDMRFFRKMDTLSINDDTAFAQLWEAIPQMTELRELVINRCPMKNLPDNFLGAKLETLQILYVGLKKLPERLGELAQLKTLQLDGNPVRELPESMSKLTNLEYLCLYQTKLEKLPKWLPQLTNLLSLNVEGTRLKALPEALFLCPKLNSVLAGYTKLERIMPAASDIESLFIENTPIKQLPDNISLLTRLNTLSIVETKIRKLPDSLAECSGLEGLFLNDTKIARLPEGLAKLPNLLYLNLLNTNIKKLPKWLKTSSICEISLDFAQVKKQVKKRKNIYDYLPENCTWYEA